MSRFVALFAAPALFLLCQGCVSHNPMSETVMFHDRESSAAREPSTGFGFFASAAPRPPSIEGAIRERHYLTAERADGLTVNKSRTSGGAYLAVFGEKRALALSLGNAAAGVDATMRLTGRNYLTLGASIPGQYQGYIQRPLFNTTRMAGALGVGYKKDLYFYDRPKHGYFHCINRCGSLEVRSIGMHGTGIIRLKNTHDGWLKFSVNWGYAYQIKEPVVEFGLAFGRF